VFLRKRAENTRQLFIAIHRHIIIIVKKGRLTQPIIMQERKSESHSAPFAKTTSKLALNPDARTLSAATPRHPVLLSPTFPLPKITISPPFLGFCPISGAARSIAASKTESADAESKITRSASSVGRELRIVVKKAESDSTDCDSASALMPAVTVTRSIPPSPLPSAQDELDCVVDESRCRMVAVNRDSRSIVVRDGWQRDHLHHRGTVRKCGGCGQCMASSGTRYVSAD